MQPHHFAGAHQPRLARPSSADACSASTPVYHPWCSPRPEQHLQSCSCVHSCWFASGRPFFRMARRDFALCLLVGTLGLAGSNYFYYLAIQKSTVALAITLQYTAPLWVLITMVLRGRERFTILRVSSVLLAMVGIALNHWPVSRRYDHQSLGSGRCHGGFLFVCFLQHPGPGTGKSGYHQLASNGLCSSGLCFLWLIVDPPWKLAAQHFSLKQWGFLFIFSCCATLVPYFFYFSGLKYLDPTRAVVASCLEPVFAILFAAAFVGRKHQLPPGSGHNCGACGNSDGPDLAGRRSQ